MFTITVTCEEGHVEEIKIGAYLGRRYAEDYAAWLTTNKVIGCCNICDAPIQCTVK